MNIKLTELEPQFKQHTSERTLHDVDSLDAAQAILFLCPVCFEKNGGPVGTHSVLVTFADRGVPNEWGTHGRNGEPSRWSVSGMGYDDLTLSPSVDLSSGKAPSIITEGDCQWHGYVRQGYVS